MKETPILFSEEMDRAIQDGRKTMTRRICFDQSAKSYQWVENASVYPTKESNNIQYTGWAKDCGKSFLLPTKCPYGGPGDLLWQKEPFIITGSDPSVRFVTGIYTRDNNEFWHKLTVEEWNKWIKWEGRHKPKSSLFMFKSLARLWLPVTAVGYPERVQDISESDIQKEGVLPDIEKVPPGYYDTNGILVTETYNYFTAFIKLWDSINGKPKPVYSRGKIIEYVSYPWGEETSDNRQTINGKPHRCYPNPWVWVVEFKRAGQP